MIVVDVAVPAIEQVYDFALDENTEISLVIEEIAGMISQKEHCVLCGNGEELLLCTYGAKAVLDRHITLKESGIVSGSRLLLV
ncbi:MAG: glutamyl-tRNA amidotransferase [bacterium]|nr:glutamyl-tRNA amidotransferase [bacterium]